MKKIIKRIVIILIALIVVCGVAMGIYCSQYYHASDDAMEALNDPSENVMITIHEGSEIDYIPDDPVAGFIFYPGGKVQYESYAPLMKKCAEKGILCVLLKVRCNLAIMDQNAADGVQERFPQVTDWYIGGHSLGGVVAGNYVSKHQDEFKGLVLLGAYTTEDLSDTDLQVLSMYGSEDGVLALDSYEENAGNLTSDFTEIVIQGGCHSYFGDYGMQDGDGEPTISRDEQMEQVAQAIYDMATSGQ